MVYLINNFNHIITFFDKESLIRENFDPTLAIEVTDEDWQRCDCMAYIEDGQIKLGKNPILNIKKQIRDLQAFLSKTDYITCKIVEGDATREDYKDIIEQRSKARKQIDELQNKLN